MSEMTIDETRVEEFVGQIVGHMTGSTLCFAIWLGDELGIYRAMAGAGPMSAEEVAAATGCQPTLIRQWLDGQAAGGLLRWDPDADTYELGAEEAVVLADDTSPAFVARAMNVLGAFHIDFDKLVAAYKGNGGLSWGDHHHSLFHGTEWFFRTGYRAMLATEWIPALDGVEERLAKGGRIADVGCGHGASCLVMAEAYPNAQVHGFDFHAPSIETARKRAAEAAVSDRTTFAVADAKGYDGTYDLICFFDCLHDMGDPVGIARYAREHLDPDGTVLLVEPFALDGRRANMEGNPLAAMLYTAGATVCTPNSLSQEVGLGIGAQAGEARHRQIFEEAGFTRFRKATETPLNLILEAQP